MVDGVAVHLVTGDDVIADATGLDLTTGEVFWALEPVPGEVVEEYRAGDLLTEDVHLRDQDLLRAYAFGTS